MKVWLNLSFVIQYLLNYSSQPKQQIIYCFLLNLSIVINNIYNMHTIDNHAIK